MLFCIVGMDDFSILHMSQGHSKPFLHLSHGFFSLLGQHPKKFPSSGLFPPGAIAVEYVTEPLQVFFVLSAA